MCSTCGGSGQLYEGNGHRMRGYPFAEQRVMVGLCPNCNPESWKPERATVEIPDYILLDRSIDAANAKMKAEGNTECYDCRTIFPDTGALYCPDCRF